MEDLNKCPKCSGDCTIDYDKEDNPRWQCYKCSYEIVLEPSDINFIEESAFPET